MKPPALPLFCAPCERKIEVLIAELQKGTAACPHCRRKIKPTREFLAVVRVL